MRGVHTSFRSFQAVLAPVATLLLAGLTYAPTYRAPNRQLCPVSNLLYLLFISNIRDMAVVRRSRFC